MAAEKGEKEAWCQKKSESSVDNQVDNETEEEPDFRDPEDFVDDVSDEGLAIHTHKNGQYGAKHAGS